MQDLLLGWWNLLLLAAAVLVRQVYLIIKGKKATLPYWSRCNKASNQVIQCQWMGAFLCPQPSVNSKAFKEVYISLQIASLFFPPSSRWALKMYLWSRGDTMRFCVRTVPSEIPHFTIVVQPAQSWLFTLPAVCVPQRQSYLQSISWNKQTCPTKGRYVRGQKGQILIWILPCSLEPLVQELPIIFKDNLEAAPSRQKSHTGMQSTCQSLFSIQWTE